MVMLRLQFLPSATSRTWRNSSLTMRVEGRANMEATALALTRQEGWHATRIVEEIR